MTPFKGANTVTSPRGSRTLNGVAAFHAGIDVTNPGGSWRVREVTGGVVSKIYTTAARGLVLEVTTDTGAIERYQHLKETLADVGQSVPQGAEIAVAGNSGECYGTPRADNEYMGGRHLHFEVLVGGKTSDAAAQWLGLPNKAGSYAGNDERDGAAPVEDTALVEARMIAANAAALAESAQNLVKMLEE